MEFDLYEAKLDSARNGDVEAALWLINDFCATVKNNRDSQGRPHRKPSGIHTQFDERILDYFRECFETLLAGKDDGGKKISADVALNLAGKGKRGRKASASTRQRHLSWGLLVMQEYNANKSSKKNLPVGSSPLDLAIERVAKQENQGIETIRDAYKEWKQLLRSAKKDGG